MLVLCEAVQMCGWTYTRHDATHCEGFIEGICFRCVFLVIAFAKRMSLGGNGRIDGFCLLLCCRLMRCL